MDINLKRAKSWIHDADALLLGASNGLSISEGYNIFANNEMFRRQFGDFQQKYGIMSVLQGCFYQYPTEATRKEYFDRLVKYWVTEYKPSQVMKDLRTLVGYKPYFILTSNGDTHLELSGFDKDKVFEIEGTFTNAFGEVEDKNPQLQSFLKQYSNGKLVILELGIGMRNTLIKRPLMQLTAQLPNVRYITLNLQKELYIPQEIAERSVGLAGDIADTLHQLVNVGA